MSPDIVEKILDIGRELAERRTLEPLLNYAMETALDLCDAEYGYLVLIEADGSLNFRVTQDRLSDTFHADEGHISHSILEQVITRRDPLITAEAIQDPALQHAESVQTLQLRSVMCVPLIAHEKVLGALYVENRTQSNVFEETDLKPLQYFAAQAAVAIENATLNDELEALVTARTAELERAMAELEQHWLEAVEINRLRSELISRITHDIRSPLTMVLGTLSLLKGDLAHKLDAEQRELLQDSLTTAQHIARLSEDFFDLINMEMGNLTINPSMTDLGNFLSGNYRAARALPWPDGVHIVLDLPPDLPSISIDTTRIRQVIINLVSNAFKFTLHGQVTLYAAMDHEHSAVLIGVRDTGPGIETDQFTAIFERFKQAGTREMRSQGVGLGLAISKELIELHQGEIWVESEVGIGSDFKFTLPLTRDSG